MSAEALALLPLWVRAFSLILAGPVMFLVSALVAAFGYWIGFRAYRKTVTTETHWTERARLAWAGRRILGVGMLMMPMMSGVLLGITTGYASLLSGWGIGVLAGISCVIPQFYVARRAGLLLGFPKKPWPEDLRGTIAGLYRLFAVILLLVVIGVAVQQALEGAWGYWFLVALLSPLLVRRELFLIGRPLGLLSPADERLMRVVEAAARKTGLTPKAVDVLENGAANAFALLFSKSILVTRRLLEVLDDAQLESVIAHEMGHLSESLGVRLLRLAPLAAVVLGLIGLYLTPPDFLIVALFAFILVLLVVLWGARRLAHRMEKRADAVAHGATDDRRYAEALEKIYEVNLVPAHLTGTAHPSLYDRMVEAGVTPLWPRPGLPPLAPLRIHLVFLVSGLVFSTIVYVVMPYVAPQALTPYVYLASGQNDAWSVGVLAQTAFDADHPENAVILYREAESLDPENPWYAANISLTLSGLGRCAEAQEAATRASRKLSDDWLAAHDWSDQEEDEADWATRVVGGAVEAAKQCKPQ